MQAFTTLTTTGYGDVVPISVLEKLVAMACMFAGMTVFNYMITSISRAMDTANAPIIRAAMIKQVGILHVASIDTCYGVKLSLLDTAVPCSLSDVCSITYLCSLCACCL
jgi:hypothetical protein